MKTLILLRHAKSSWDQYGLRDFDRPLNKRGERDARSIGRWLAQQAIRPDIILCSSALRAEETLELVLERFPMNEHHIQYHDDLYLASKQTIYNKAVAFLHSEQSVMIVGHNPGLEQVLSSLCENAQPQENGKLFTTANCAIIEYLPSQKFELIKLIRPKELTNL